MAPTYKKINTGIINPDTDDGEIVILYMDTPSGVVVWFEDGYSMVESVPIEVIRMAAAKIK